MIPTPEAAGVASSAQQLSSQNLFDYAAQQAQNAAQQGPGPAELGSRLLDNFDGFVSRNAQFDASFAPASQDPVTAAAEAPRQQPDSLDVMSGLSEGAAGKSVAGPDIDHMVQTLGRVFDHAAETQLVSTGATQVSSSVSSLLHGR